MRHDPGKGLHPSRQSVAAQAPAPWRSRRVTTGWNSKASPSIRPAPPSFAFRSRAIAATMCSTRNAGRRPESGEPFSMNNIKATARAVGAVVLVGRRIRQRPDRHDSRAAGAPGYRWIRNYHNYVHNNAPPCRSRDLAGGTRRPCPAAPVAATTRRAAWIRCGEFKLRRRHPGTRQALSTADDVVFTFLRAECGRTARRLRCFQRHHPRRGGGCRDHPPAHAPTASADADRPRLASIIARHVKARRAGDFNSGRAAIGTGPYRQASYRLGDRVEFERSANWFGPAQPFKVAWSHRRQ